MPNNHQQIIHQTAAFVQSSLQGAEAGHDWFHIQRVWKNAKAIAAGEQVDMFIVELAALLHDIADAKFQTKTPVYAGVPGRVFFRMGRELSYEL